MNIEIITTPNDELKETGFGTLKACEHVFKAILDKGYSVKLSVCEDMTDLEKVVDRKPDLVILAVKYISTNDGKHIWLSDYFAKNNIYYSGSSREVLRYDSDKVLAKLKLRRKGIKTANFFTAIPGEHKCENDLPLAFPLFLKPFDAANGNGVDDLSFVTNFHEFESKVQSLHALYNIPVLVEEYLDGREFTVAVMKSSNGELIAAPIELVPAISSKGLRILGEKAKRDDSESLRKITDELIKAKVKKLAVDAFLNLGARDFGRIDIKANSEGDCFFMEANLVPGMTCGSSYFPKAWEIEYGISYQKVVALILEGALRRVPVVKTPNQNTNLALA